MRLYANNGANKWGKSSPHIYLHWYSPALAKIKNGTASKGANLGFGVANIETKSLSVVVRSALLWQPIFAPPRSATEALR